MMLVKVAAVGVGAGDLMKMVMTMGVQNPLVNSVSNVNVQHKPLQVHLGETWTALYRNTAIRN